MTQWNRLRVLPLTLAAAALLAPAAARADDFVLGDWENNSTDGWIDWGSQSDITAPEYTFSSDTGVTRGSSSLHLDQAGWSQTLSLKLEYQPGAMAAFFAHKQFQIDVTVPASDSGGWAEIYQLWINAAGYGFTGQSATNPVKQWGWGPTGGGAQTTTLTFDYSKLVDGNAANGEISPSAGYIEFIFATNNDGTHTSFYFDNARLTNPPLPGDANLDGLINADDYTLVDRGFAMHLTGWANGDFNNDGVVDQNDYLILDTAYGQAQGLSPDLLAERQSEFGAAYVQELLASVPEPTSLAAFGIALLPLLTRRRRTRLT